MNDNLEGRGARLPIVEEKLGQIESLKVDDPLANFSMITGILKEINEGDWVDKEELTPEDLRDMVSALEDMAEKLTQEINGTISVFQQQLETLKENNKAYKAKKGVDNSSEENL